MEETFEAGFTGVVRADAPETDEDKLEEVLTGELAVDPGVKVEDDVSGVEVGDDRLNTALPETGLQTVEAVVDSETRPELNTSSGMSKPRLKTSVPRGINGTERQRNRFIFRPTVN